MKYFVVFILVIVRTVWAYSSGAPISACETMTPNHFGGVPPQTDMSPFILNVTNDGGQAVDSILIPQLFFCFRKHVAGAVQSNLKYYYAIVDFLRILTNEGDTFQGFLVQARDENNQIVGTFSVADPQARTMTCPGGKNNAATHVDLLAKTEVELRWSPPSYMKVNITATVLRDASTFWVGQQEAYEGAGSSIQANFIVLMTVLVLQQLWTRTP